MPDLNRSQKSAHGLISRWGKAGRLVRNGNSRTCIAARNAYSPRERALVVDGAERIFISAYGLTIAPDYELDLLNWDGKWYRFIGPTKGPRPNGLIIFHDCDCMEVAAP